jgi:hypothetical protein
VPVDGYALHRAMFHLWHGTVTDTLRYLCFAGVVLSELRAAALADRLELDVMTVGVCLACLSFAAVPLEAGDERTARREARRLAPDLWAEGLELPTLLALERAKRDGVRDAREAIEDVRMNRAESATVRAIVWQLAVDLAEDLRQRRLHHSGEVT